MEMIEERLKELEVEKTDILNKYPEEDEANQSVYAMAIVRILMEVKFLNKLNASLKEKERKNKQEPFC